MLKLLLIFVIRFDVLIAPHTSITGGIGNRYRKTLPLVLIRTADGRLIRPTELPLPLRDLTGNFLFGTHFAAGEERNQLFFCGSPPHEENTGTSEGDGGNSDDRYILHELSEPISEPGSTPSTIRPRYLRCPYEPEPYVVKLTEKNNVGEEVEVHCGSVESGGQKNRMYAYAYKVKTNGDNKTHIFVVYKFCYEEKEEKVLFTEHTIASPKLLNSSSLLREQNEFYDMSVEGYRYFGTRYLEIFKEYIQFLAQKKRNKWNADLVEESMITFKSELTGEQLVPPEDMALALWRKSTFHVLNSALMDDKKIDLWKNIIHVIKQNAKDTSREYLVYTGAFYKTDEGKVENETIQSPDFWIKIVQYKNENGKEPDASIAIVMIHNPKIKSVAETFTEICPENVCDKAFVQAFPEIGESVCCTTTMAKVGHYFGLHLNDNQPLKIPGLYTKEKAPTEVQELPTEMREIPERAIWVEKSAEGTNEDLLENEDKTPEEVQEEVFKKTPKIDLHTPD